LLALLLAQATGHLPLRAVEALDRAVYDLRLRAFAAGADNRRVAVVDIDERALAEVGRGRASGWRH
jgi:adenylate cyclase